MSWVLQKNIIGSPKQSISNIIADAGGKEHVKGPYDIPKNRHIPDLTRCDIVKK